MEIIFTPKATAHLKYWKKSGNKAIQKKIEQLLADILKNPFAGIGKPEALKYDLSGKWSRRITEEHRMIYDIKEDIINVYRLKDHY